jgi:hypothetical protein
MIWFPRDPQGGYLGTYLTPDAAAEKITPSAGQDQFFWE